MVDAKKITRVKNIVWETLCSPKVVAFIKVGAAVVGVIHAIEELRGSSRKKSTIGFRFEDDSDAE